MIDEDTYNTAENVVVWVEGQNMREIPTEVFHARWFSTRPKAASESPKEATNEGAEDRAAVNETLGEDVPKGGQQPSGRRELLALRQRGVPVERVHFRISEESCLSN